MQTYQMVITEKLNDFKPNTFIKIFDWKTIWEGSCVWTFLEGQNLKEKFLFQENVFWKNDPLPLPFVETIT